MLNSYEFVFITTRQNTRFSIVLPLTEDDFTAAPLPFASVVHADKSYLLNRDLIIKPLTGVTDNFLAQICKLRVLRGVRQHYAAAHQRKNPFVTGQRIAYGGRFFDSREIENLVDASLDFWLTAGPYAARFEKQLAAYLGSDHCSLVNSGSSANLLAFMALTSPVLGDRQIRRGDEVITVAACFPTTVAPIIQYGAVPVFVDVTLPSYNIDCSVLEAARSPRTRAVMLAHTLGNPFNLQTVRDFCRKYDLWLIEDNCDALGSRYQLDGTWHYTGTVGDIGTSSFYPPHHMTMGEGGALYTNDAQLKKLIDSFRDWGRDCWCPS